MNIRRLESGETEAGDGSGAVRAARRARARGHDVERVARPRRRDHWAGERPARVHERVGIRREPRALAVAATARWRRAICVPESSLLGTAQRLRIPADPSVITKTTARGWEEMR